MWRILQKILACEYLVLIDKLAGGKQSQMIAGGSGSGSVPGHNYSAPEVLQGEESGRRPGKARQSTLVETQLSGFAQCKGPRSNQSQLQAKPSPTAALGYLTTFLSYLPR